MKANFSKLTQAAPAAFLALTLISLSGCVADDAMNDDSLHTNAQASENYPLHAMRGHGSRCGNWPEDLTETSDNVRYSNHGCAVQANIAAELANPATIDTPVSTDPPAGARAAAAVRGLDGAKSGGLFSFLFGP